MENNRSFLTQFLDQEIYLIQEDAAGYSVPDSGSEKPAEVKEDAFVYEGSNSAGLVVIIEENTKEEEMILLQNILKSVNVEIEDVALLRSDSQFQDHPDRISDIEASRILSFGVTSGKSRLLDIQTKYAPTTVENRTIILADTLSELNEKKDLKRELWNVLKEVF